MTIRCLKNDNPLLEAVDLAEYAALIFKANLGAKCYLYIYILKKTDR